jgi:hypothetical protein
MKNHLYLLAALAVILSMVMVGCATSAPEVAPVESVAEGSTGTLSAATKILEEGTNMAPNGTKAHPFPLHGVIIYTPPEYTVKPSEHDDLPEVASVGVPPGSKYFRPVFRFDLYRDGEKVTQDYPDIGISVHWTPVDGQYGKPKLVIDWGENEYIEIQNVEYHPPDVYSAGGVARKMNLPWGGDDPGIGWSD